MNHSKIQASFFPTKLSDMERLHASRHSPTAPNVIFCCLKFDNQLDRETLEQAIRLAGERHVLIGAMISPNQKTWTGKASIWYTLHFHQRPFCPSEFRAHGCDLAKEQNVHFDVFESDQGSELIVEIHHCHVDGLGGLQAVSDILLIYDNLAHQRPPFDRLRRLDPRALHVRNRIGLFSRGFIRRLPLQWIPVYGAIKFGLAKIVPLIKVTSHSAERKAAPHPFPNFVNRKIPDQLKEGLVNAAAKYNTSINDLLLSSMFRATQQWHKQREYDRPENHNLRVLVPVSIRDSKDRRCGACNRMAFVQLDRRGALLNDPSGLAKSIHYELGIIRKYKFEKATAIVLRLMAWIPGALERNTSKTKCRATTLLSNVGSPFKRLRLPRENGILMVGNTRLVDVTLVAPFYDLTPAVFLHSQYADRHSITLAYDTKVLSSDDATELMDFFTKAIETIGVMSG